MKKFSVITILCIFTIFTFTCCNINKKTENNLSNLLKEKHTITLVTDDLSNKEITTTNGDVLIIDFTPKKINYLFKGWYTDSNCTVPYDFSQPVTTNFTLYAGFTLKTKTINCKDIKIKALSSSYDNDKSFYLSLVGFDYDYLEKNSMGLQFKISYNVKYIKDYVVPLDIGYAGSPKYELTLINDSLHGYFEENLSTTTSEAKKCYTYNTALPFSKDNVISLFFSTDNIQNIISFSNIEVVIDAINLK